MHVLVEACDNGLTPHFGEHLADFHFYRRAIAVLLRVSIVPAHRVVLAASLSQTEVFCVFPVLDRGCNAEKIAASPPKSSKFHRRVDGDCRRVRVRLRHQSTPVLETRIITKGFRIRLVYDDQSIRPHRPHQACQRPASGNRGDGEHHRAPLSVQFVFSQ